MLGIDVINAANSACVFIVVCQLKSVKASDCDALTYGISDGVAFTAGLTSISREKNGEFFASIDWGCGSGDIKHERNLIFLSTCPNFIDVSAAVCAGIGKTHYLDYLRSWGHSAEFDLTEIIEYLVS